MGYRNIINDGTLNPPRLRPQYNMWAAIGLPRGAAEWSVPEKLDKIAAAGFTGFEAFATSSSEADELKKMLNDRGLGIGFQGYPHKPDDLLPTIELAHRMGADYITAQVFGSLMRARDIADMLEEMYELVNGSGLPFYVETHRGRVTQDLRRTLLVIDRLPRVRFTGDFSHYICAGEIGGEWPVDIWEAFTRIAERCGNFHGRIGYGEQIQNDIGDGANPTCEQFKKLWTIGMRKWLSKARPGDVLPFCSELGPPGYSVTDLEGREISDRWEQSLVVKRLAQEAFADAQAQVALTPSA